METELPPAPTHTPHHRLYYHLNCMTQPHRLCECIGVRAAGPSRLLTTVFHPAPFCSFIRVLCTHMNAHLYQLYAIYSAISTNKCCRVSFVYIFTQFYLIHVLHYIILSWENLCLFTGDRIYYIEFIQCRIRRKSFLFPNTQPTPPTPTPVPPSRSSLRGLFISAVAYV